MDETALWAASVAFLGISVVAHCWAWSRARLRDQDAGRAAQMSANHMSVAAERA